MSNNPLRKTKYDVRAFHVWNWAVRRSIRAYDEDYVKDYPQELLDYAYVPGVFCLEQLCDERVKYRRKLCEKHREQRYMATKRLLERKRYRREQQASSRSQGPPEPIESAAAGTQAPASHANGAGSPEAGRL